MSPSAEVAETPSPARPNTREKAEAIIAMLAHAGGTHRLKASAGGPSLTPRDATRTGWWARRGQDTVETLKQACFQGYPESAGCVQGSIDSRNSAIHSAYRISLRPSSLFEPRHPSLKVVKVRLLETRLLERFGRVVHPARADQRAAAERENPGPCRAESSRSPSAVRPKGPPGLGESAPGR